MSASIWEPDGNILVASEGTLRVEHFTITNPLQVVFTLTEFSYAPNTTSLSVYLNGVYQRSGIDFIESGSDNFTFLGHTFTVGDTVTAVGIVAVRQIQTVASAQDTAFTPTPEIAATNVQDALVEVEARAAEDLAATEVSLLAAIATKANSSSVPAQFNPIQGANITLSGTYPNITFAATASAPSPTGSLTEEVVVLGNPGTGSGTDRWKKTHSLGVVPKIIVVEAVCVSANNGYAVGDVIEIRALGNPTTFYPINFRKSASSVTPLYLGFGFVHVPTDASAYFVLDSSWSVRYRLFA